MGAWQRHSDAGVAARTKAVVARKDAHAWLRGDRARAPSSVDRQPERTRAGSCVGTDRTDDRRDPDHRAVASPRGAVISSAPARALLRFDQPSHLAGPLIAVGPCPGAAAAVRGSHSKWWLLPWKTGSVPPAARVAALPGGPGVRDGRERAHAARPSHEPGSRPRLVPLATGESGGRAPHFR